MRDLSPFLRRFLRHRWTLLAGFLCIPVAQLADIGLTVLAGDAINRMRESTDTDFLPRLLVLFAVFAVVHAVFRYLQRWWIVVVSRMVEVRLKQDLFDKLTSLSFSFHNRSRSGDVVSRVTSDVENLRMFLGPGLMYTAGALIVVPVTLVLLFTLHPLLASLMLVPMALMGLAMKGFSPRLYRYSMAVQESLGDISHRAQENFSGIRVVKGYSREAAQSARFAATSEENRDNQIRLGHARGLTHAAIHGANDLTFVAILVVGGLAAIDRELAYGDLFKFIDLTLKVFWPLISLGWIAGMYPRAIASAKRVQELLSEQPEIVDPEVPLEPARGTGALSLEDVTFRYPLARRPAVQGIDLEVPSGTTVGIVGPTGAGKTTLLNLLGRLFEGEGQIRLDGVPIDRMRLGRLRGALGYVPQDSFLFSDTYRENILLGAEEPLDDEEIHRLIERAGMADEVRDFPDGLDQLIGERGVTLSGGQRQRTCIARALARDPEVLVLDDALSAVDSETERQLLSNLRDEGRGRTVIVAAHRLSTVADADQILVLAADGSVADLGTHDELVAREGWYRRTWRQQQRQAELGL